MSDMKAAEASEQLSTDNNVKEKVDGDASDEGPVILDQTEENAMPSSQEEEEVIKKKYGGMLLKKPPLISKDHERAYFDSADWALGKQGGQPHKPKGPLEALRPKLQNNFLMTGSFISISLHVNNKFVPAAQFMHLVIMKMVVMLLLRM
ncbi:uncharacterized protein [Elaeis guineensis]|uniref:Uncharacterized protein LOC105048763 isoform X2 n=1 Tax=Elaeis guineensis var. tenera TaxID=51953 RepID=A0A6I9RPZ4_ELAGV|nr:uncharacterized protein LOC105048763 isoform X2 [Elaeis guineensis]